MTSLIRNHVSLGGSGCSTNSNILNNKEVSCSIDFSNWKILKQKIETIYQISKFDFSMKVS